MPLYEYKCTKCGSIIEVIQKVNEKPLTTCNKCGAVLRKLISKAAIQFKGNGWYVTDYAQKEKTPPEPKKKKKTPSPSPVS